MSIVKHIIEHEKLGLTQRLDDLDKAVRGLASAPGAPAGGGGGGGGGEAVPIAVQDGGIVVDPDVRKINFKGAGVTAAKVGDTVEVTVPGGGGGGGSVIFSETDTGDTLQAADYPSGTFLVNTVASLMWVNVMQTMWLMLSGGGGANVLTDLMTESGLQLTTESGLTISIN